MKKDFIVGIALGSFAALLVLVAFSYFSAPVTAETGIGNSQLITVPGNINAERQDAIYIFDPNAKRLAVYVVSNQGAFNVKDVRNVRYDLQLDFIKRQSPSVGAIRKKSRGN